MVTKRTTIGIIASFVLMTASVLGWVYIIPTISDGPVPAQQVILSHALNVYRTRHESAPAALVDLEPVLGEVTNSKCSIVRIGKDVYRVWVNLGGRRTDVFKVEYKLGKDDYREKCHVYNIRKFNHPK